jgi:glycolate oxidase iron-sulfur subunit
MLLGCVQREYFPGVNAATARVLSAEGCHVVVPPRQGCCGALSLHSGREREAIRFAQQLIADFPSGLDAVVVNSAGCGSAMKSYPHLLREQKGWTQRAERFAAQVRDVAEWLVELGPRAPRHPLPISVAYQDACHLAHGQGVRDQPRTLLAAVPELKLEALAEPELCCGSAGVYNLLQPDPARVLGARKAAHVIAAGADLLVSANPGCLLQLRAALHDAGRHQPIAHTVEVLDASIRDLGPTALTRR